MNVDLERAPYLRNVNFPLIRILCESVSQVQGDFIEFGVYMGHTFKHIYESARAGEKTRNIYAVDSFEGIPESESPTENRRYKPGSLKGSYYLFKKQFKDAIVVKGLIPDILDDLPIDKIAFAHVDLDQAESTLATLNWVWDRISDLGIVCIHDYYHHDNIGASAAVKVYMYNKGLDYIGLCDTSIFFQKGVS